MLSADLRNRFDYATYWRLLDHIGSHNRLVPFREVSGDASPERFAILRHDVDYSPESALHMARGESARGIQATYFLLLSGTYYNLLSPDHADFAGKIGDLGHEVGLHYDVNFFRGLPRSSWNELLEAQASLLSRLSGGAVTSISMHQPGLNGADPFKARGGFVNAYDDRYVRDIPYISDSCQAWRDDSWAMLMGPIPPRFQLCLHPINWSDDSRDRTSVFTGVHAAVQASMEAAKHDLLAKIAVHAGVLEHEAANGRTARRNNR
jgi:hypothetical protein